VGGGGLRTPWGGGSSDLTVSVGLAGVSEECMEGTRETKRGAAVQTLSKGLDVPFGRKNKGLHCAAGGGGGND